MAAQLDYADAPPPPPLSRPALLVAYDCPHCHGAGLAATEPLHYCSHHRITWSHYRFDALMAACDRGWRVPMLGWRIGRGRRYHWRELPCGCPLTELRLQRYTVCRACGGSGVRHRAATREETLQAAGALPPLSARPSPRRYTVPPMTTF